MKEGFDGLRVEGLLVLLDLLGWVLCLDAGVAVTVLETVGFEFALTEGFDEGAFVGITFGFLVG